MESIVTKPIKLAIVINGFLIGGAQKLILDFFEHLDCTKFEPVLITLMRSKAPGQNYFYSLLPKDAVVFDLRFRNFHDLRAWGTLWRALRTTKPDLVFSNLFFSNTVTRLLKPFFGYRVVTVEHNTYTDKTRAQQTVDRILAPLSDNMVAVSDTVADFTSKQEGIPRSRFTVITSGIDIERIQKTIKETDRELLRKELGFSPEDKVILNVSRVVPQKNHKLLLEGFVLFAKQHSGYRLLIVGGGSLLGEMESYAKELGISEKVRFMGYQKEMFHFFSIADFFVSTSLIEGFGITHAEALAAGLPVLSTKTAGPDKMIRPGVNGAFIPDYTDKAVAESLTKMAAADLTPMRAAARASAEEHSIKRVVRDYSNLFEKTMRRHT